MLTLLLWHCALAFGVSARHDSPIVIERPLNRVEFDDLLMEYNHDQGPTSNLTVNASLTLNSARFADDILRASLTLEQTWTDTRLLFKGVSEVPLPNNVHPWQPDTVIVNALRSETRMAALFLNYDGTLRKRQLLVVEVPCEEPLEANAETIECRFVLTSFSNRGVDEITYTVENVDTDRVARITNATVAYDALQDHHHRRTHSASITVHVHNALHHNGDLIVEVSKP